MKNLSVNPGVSKGVHVTNPSGDSLGVKNPPSRIGASRWKNKRTSDGPQHLRAQLHLCSDTVGIPEQPPHLSQSPDREMLVIARIYESYNNPAFALAVGSDIARAVAFILENYMQAITIEEVSRVVFMSVRQLQRKFKRTLGIRPHQFLIQARVLASCRMLRETNESLTSVALTCGFFDQSAFGRHFNRHVRMTPARFRSGVWDGPVLK